MKGIWLNFYGKSKSGSSQVVGVDLPYYVVFFTRRLGDKSNMAFHVPNRRNSPNQTLKRISFLLHWLTGSPYLDVNHWPFGFHFLSFSTCYFSSVFFPPFKFFSCNMEESLLGQWPDFSFGTISLVVPLFLV